MNSQQVSDLAKNLRIPYFIGCFASDDLLPALLKYPKRNIFSCIVNTQDSSKSGEHWLAVLIDLDRDKSVEVYDSFAENPPKKIEESLLKFIRDRKPLSLIKYKVNSVINQRSNSQKCGLYAIQFLYNRLILHKSFSFSTGFDTQIRDAEKNLAGFHNFLIRKDFIPKKFPLI